MKIRESIAAAAEPTKNRIGKTNERKTSELTRNDTEIRNRTRREARKAVRCCSTAVIRVYVRVCLRSRERELYFTSSFTMSVVCGSSHSASTLPQNDDVDGEADGRRAADSEESVDATEQVDARGRPREQ